MSDTLVTAVINRLTAALPSWHDASGDPHPTPDKALPAFAVGVTYASSERVSMDDPRHWREGQLIIGITIKPGQTGAEADIQVKAATMAAAIMADPPDLGGVVWEINPEGFEADHERGENRITSGDLTFAFRTIE